MIYDIRFREYTDEIIGGVNRFKLQINVLGPMSSLAECFTRYFTGDDDIEKHSTIMVDVSALLNISFRNFMDYSSKYLK